MPAIPYWFIAKMFLALFIGFWIASRLRGILRAIVVRSMPLRYRMSDEYFNMQTRISMIVAVVIGLGIATLAYWGLSEAEKAISVPVISRSSTVEIEPSPSSPLAAPPPVEVHQPEEAPPAEEEAIPESYDIPETSDSDNPIRPTPKMYSPSYYLQLHAFISDTRAWTQKDYWGKRLPQGIHIGIQPNAPVPYKVLAPSLAEQKLSAFGKSTT